MSADGDNLIDFSEESELTSMETDTVIPCTIKFLQYGHKVCTAQLYDAATNTFINSGKELIQFLQSNTQVHSRTVPSEIRIIKLPTGDVVEIFNILQISAEEQVSLLIRELELTKPSYLLPTYNPNEVQCSLVIEQTSELEIRSWNNELCKVIRKINKEQQTTHAIESVYKGKRVFITLKSSNHSQEEMNGILNKLIEDFKSHKDNEFLKDVTYQVNVNGVSVTCKNSNDVWNYLKCKEPIIIQLGLMPIVQDLFQVNMSVFCKLVTVCTQVHRYLQGFDERLKLLSSCTDCVCVEMLQMLACKQAEVKQLQQQLLEYLKQVRNTKCLGKCDILIDIDNKLMQMELFLFESLQPSIDTYWLHKTWKEKNIVYIGNEGSLHDIIQSDSNVYVFCFSSILRKTNPDLFQETYNLFLKLASSCLCVVFDVGLNNNAPDLYKFRRNRIFQYKNGVCFSDDLLKDYRLSLHRNMIQLNCEPEKIIRPPLVKSSLKLVCPNSRTGTCNGDIKEWCCSKCRANIKYGCDKNYYCKCGKTPVLWCSYRCCEKKHKNYVKFDKPEDLMNELKKLRPMKELNILILGQSGVGKSTWINSIVNYLSYDSLQDARDHHLKCVIPTSFFVADKDFKKQIVIFGDENPNEVISVGKSATQSPTTYSFGYEDYFVKLIDTPGVGDTDGLEKDAANFRKIIEHVSSLSEIHGICVLMKPNEDRLTAILQYCIRELLCNLDAAAVDNMAFVFTNVRSTFYRPGSSLKLLISLLEANKIKIDLSKKNVYCLENEAFRYLCTLKYPNITYDDTAVALFEESWKKSVDETHRLFEYIKQLKPFSLRTTASLCSIKNILSIITEPLVDICLNICSTISCLEEQKEKLLKCCKKKKEFQNLSHLIKEPIIVKLDPPKVTCKKCKSNPFCNIYACSQKRKQFPSIRKGKKKCYSCNCLIEDHQLVWFETQYKPVTVEMPGTTDKLNTVAAIERQVKDIENDMQIKLSSLICEMVTIVEVCVVLRTFLAQNSLTNSEDLIYSKLEYMVNIESHKPPAEQQKMYLEHLKCFLSLYTDGLQKHRQTVVSVTDVDGALACLKNIPLHGSFINELINETFDFLSSAKESEEQDVILDKEEISVPSKTTFSDYISKSWGVIKRFVEGKGNTKIRNINQNEEKRYASSSDDEKNDTNIQYKDEGYGRNIYESEQKDNINFAGETQKRDNTKLQNKDKGYGRDTGVAEKGDNTKFHGKDKVNDKDACYTKYTSVTKTNDEMENSFKETFLKTESQNDYLWGNVLNCEDVDMKMDTNEGGFIQQDTNNFPNREQEILNLDLLASTQLNPNAKQFTSCLGDTLSNCSFNLSEPMDCAYLSKPLEPERCSRSGIDETTCLQMKEGFVTLNINSDSGKHLISDLPIDFKEPAHCSKPFESKLKNGSENNKRAPKKSLKDAVSYLPAEGGNRIIESTSVSNKIYEPFDTKYSKNVTMSQFENCAKETQEKDRKLSKFSSNTKHLTASSRSSNVERSDIKNNNTVSVHSSQTMGYREPTKPTEEASKNSGSEEKPKNMPMLYSKITKM